MQNVTIEPKANIISPRSRRWRGPVVAALLSLLGVTLIWRMAPPPNWESDLVSGKSRPLGFTRDGQLVSLDDGRLTVRETATGTLLDLIVSHEPVSTQWDWGELTPNGEWVILRGKNSPHLLHVLDWRNGQPRCPPIQVAYTNPTGAISSPNGRFKQIASGAARHSIVDLSTGMILCDCRYQAQFARDTQQFATFDSRDNQGVVFHSLEEGREIGRASLPPAPVGKWSGLGQWHGDRLELETKEPHAPKGNSPSNGYNRRTWSFRVSDAQFTDMQAEPALVGSMLPVKVGAALQTYWESGDGWAMRVAPHNPPPEKVVGGWNWLSACLPSDPFRWIPVTGSEWQLVSRETGKPLHRPIFGKAFGVAVSPDGKWLALGGERLRVWHLPPRSRLPWILLTAIGPWLPLAWSRWRRVKLTPS